jgi:hypothetical protein
MLKFRSTDNLEAYISSAGCLVLKQDSFEFGKEVSIVLTPAMAWELQSLINANHEEMTFAWADGMVKGDDYE